MLVAAGLLLAGMCAAPITLPAAAQTSQGDRAETFVAAEPDSAEVQSRLAPPEIGSPRQTLESLRTYTQRARTLLQRAFALSKATGQVLDTPEIVSLKRDALVNLRRASETLDLSNVPPAAKQNVGLTSALLLKEVLDRIAVPDPAEIPDLEDVQAGKVPAGWRIPGTEIYMARFEDADGSPLFRFSAETVGSLQRYYDRVVDLPSHDPDNLDFYVSYKTAPGFWLPVSFYRKVLELPPSLQAIYWQQAAWKWIALGLLTLLLLVGVVLLTWRDVRQGRSVSPKRRALRRLVTPLGLIAMLVCYREIAANVINLSGDVLFSIELSVKILITLLGAWLLVLVFTLLGEILLSSPRINRESLDGSMIRLVLKVLGIAGAAYILTIGATQVGIPIYGIVAGIGVGGLAIALAIRPTLENLIAGIILYSDRVVRVGDFCQFGDMLGTVETIGLRSTKIRALDRTLITVQNAELVQMRIVNFTRRDSNLFNPTVRLLYRTSTEQLEAIIDQTRKMLESHPQIKPETVRVTFRQYGPYSLDVELWAYAIPSVWAEFLAVQEDLLIKFRKIVEANGSGFAIPSQTSYLVTGSSGRADDETPPRDARETLLRVTKPRPTA